MTDLIERLREDGMPSGCGECGKPRTTDPDTECCQECQQRIQRMIERTALKSRGVV